MTGDSNVFFLHRIKHTISNNAWDKGIEVKDYGISEVNYEAAKQAFHAYLGAYAYNHDSNCDYVSCMITDITGSVMKPFDETWMKATEPEPESEPEPEVETEG